MREKGKSVASAVIAARLTAADIEALAAATEVVFSFNGPDQASFIRVFSGPWNTHPKTSRWFPEHDHGFASRVVTCGVEIIGFESPHDDEWSSWTQADAPMARCRATVNCEGNQFWASVVATLRPGDQLTLAWFADVTTTPMYVASLTADELWIRVDRRPRWWHRLLGRAARRRRTQPLWQHIEHVIARRADPDRFVDRYGYVDLDADQVPVAGW